MFLNCCIPNSLMRPVFGSNGQSSVHTPPYSIVLLA